MEATKKAIRYRANKDEKLVLENKRRIGRIFTDVICLPFYFLFTF